MTGKNTRTNTEVALDLLGKALGAMNEAIEITWKQGPAEAMEFIADYLNNTDAIDEKIADECPEDWLDRWKVERR